MIARMITYVSHAWFRGYWQAAAEERNLRIMEQKLLQQQLQTEAALKHLTSGKAN